MSFWAGYQSHIQLGLLTNHSTFSVHRHLSLNFRSTSKSFVGIYAPPPPTSISLLQCFRNYRLIVTERSLNYALINDEVFWNIIMDVRIITNSKVEEILDKNSLRLHTPMKNVCSNVITDLSRSILLSIVFIFRFSDIKC